MVELVRKRVTSFDVAQATGLSQPTVSRALRNDERITPETVRKVRNTAAALGYVPSDRARDLSSGSTHRVAMVVNLDNSLWSLLVGRLHDQLAVHGYRLTLLAAHGDPVGVESQVLGGGVDGVIISTTTLDSQLPLTLHRAGIPTVLLNRFTEGSSNPGNPRGSQVDASVGDNFGGGELAAHMLLNAGHREIGALFGPKDTSTGRDREAGFRRTILGSSTALERRWIRHGDFTYGHGFTGVHALFESGAVPSALFCANDMIALGALNAAHELGLKVPDDLALIGFDDLDFTAWPRNSLSTIAIPFDDLIQTAVAMLLERIGGFTGRGRRVIHPVMAVPRKTHTSTTVGADR